MTSEELRILQEEEDLHLAQESSDLMRKAAAVHRMCLRRGMEETARRLKVSTEEITDFCTLASCSESILPLYLKISSTCPVGSFAISHRMARVYHRYQTAGVTSLGTVMRSYDCVGADLTAEMFSIPKALVQKYVASANFPNASG